MAVVDEETEEEEGKKTPHVEFPHDRQFQDLRAEGEAVEMDEWSVKR